MNVIISGIIPSCDMAAKALIDDPMQRLMQYEETLLGSPCEKPTSISLAGTRSFDPETALDQSILTFDQTG